MITKGDTISLVKSIPGFDRVGDNFTVVDILEGEMEAVAISCGYGMGVISADGFKQFFKKKVVKMWTPWSNILFGDKVYAFRTNNKRVEMKRNGIKASASCHPLDTFDLEVGLAWCAERIRDKARTLIEKRRGVQ